MASAPTTSLPKLTRLSVFSTVSRPLQVFPLFMKYVTGGYVGEDEAGERLAECVYGDETRESGQYYSWNGNAQQVGLVPWLFPFLIEARGRRVEGRRRS